MAKSISDLLESRQTDLMSHPHLIIDLRGNGGGADYSFYPLVPHIYTNPMKVAGEDFWASPENAEHLRVFLKESDFPEEYHKGMQDLIERMEAEPNTFVTGAPDQTIEIEDILDHPERIGILIDEKCASSTEEFLLMAAQSKKVTLIGSNTRGSLDYSNLRNIELPSPLCQDRCRFRL